jgi:RNA 3'-terminal phosphate cyclase
MAFAGEGSFPALKVNPHARKNVDVIGKFLPVEFRTTVANGPTKVEISTRY